MFSIETPRLILRDLLAADFSPFYQLCCEPEVTRFQDFLRVENATQARDMLKTAEFHNRLRPRRSYSLAILRKPDLAWIGWIGLGKSDDPALGDMQFGYAIQKPYWGQGYMSEALQRVVAFCFNELGIGKIYGECIEKNEASARVMQKAGLRLELAYPDVDEETGAACFALRYSLTREEWGKKAPPA